MIASFIKLTLALMRYHTRSDDLNEVNRCMRFLKNILVKNGVHVEEYVYNGRVSNKLTYFFKWFKPVKLITLSRRRCKS